MHNHDFEVFSTVLNNRFRLFGQNNLVTRGFFVANWLAAQLCTQGFLGSNPERSSGFFITFPSIFIATPDVIYLFKNITCVGSNKVQSWECPNLSLEASQCAQSAVVIINVYALQLVAMWQPTAWMWQETEPLGRTKELIRCVFRDSVWSLTRDLLLVYAIMSVRYHLSSWTFL